MVASSQFTANLDIKGKYSFQDGQSVIPNMRLPYQNQLYVIPGNVSEDSA